jgi:hypothetical protein
MLVTRADAETTTCATLVVLKSGELNAMTLSAENSPELSPKAGLDLIASVPGSGPVTDTVVPEIMTD